MPERPKILVVDDDPVSLRLVQRALETMELYEIRTAVDGQEGLQAARAFHPDLIICDKVMPHVDGLEVCRRIKGDPELQSAVFVILTAADDPRARIEGLEQGADDYLTKPVPAEEMRARVRTLLRRRVSDKPSESEAVPEAAEQVRELLVRAMDLAWPGAANRAVQMSLAASWIAEDVGLPLQDRPHLELAVQLQRLGMLGLPAASRRPTGESGLGESYQVYAAASWVLLSQFEGFAQAALLIRHQFENWDGSGWPHHLDRARILQGSRILRVLVDFFEDWEMVAAAAGRRKLVETLEQSSGRLYDPAVCRSLRNYVQHCLEGSLATGRRYVSVEGLKPGMRLAGDLITASGAILLREDQVLGVEEIWRLRRHHQSDPIVFTICVYPAPNEKKEGLPDVPDRP